MAGVAVERAVRHLVARCHVGLDASSLKSEFVERLRRFVPVDAAFCATVDPATLLFTGAFLWHIPPESTSRFLTNEFLEDDVNKFTALAGRKSPVEWLDRATGNRRTKSVRYREILAPLGLGDELRAAFRSGGQCWGFVCVHREQATAGYTEADARLVARLTPHMGEGLRRALLVGAASATCDADGPGVLLVDESQSLVATTVAGDRWLWELSDPDHPIGRMPIAVEAVLTRLQAVRSGAAPVDVQPRVRVRTRSGWWAVLHAADMAGLAEGRHVAVVVERATATDLAPIILLAHGLTSREADVARLTLQGKRTKVVSRELRISENTVEDHLKSIFGKVGVGSRGELTARLFSDHYAH